MRVFWLYRRFGEFDPFFSAAFLISFVACLIVNFLLSLIYYTTGIEWLVFKVNTIGLSLLIPFGTFMIYFYRQNPKLRQQAISFDEPLNMTDWIILALLVIGLLLGFFSGFLYRWCYLG